MVDYYSHPKRSVDVRKILTWTFTILVVFVLYLLLFNPQLPQGALQILSPIIWMVELVILVSGLMLINGVDLGESDLGIWGMGILGVVLIFFGVVFFFAAGFVPRMYERYDAGFGVILGILGLFAAFRTRRRHGRFVYVR